MKFKNQLKRFFTLSRSAEGFTLVELIVVIAILGILATIAVPAYAGYVEKSQLAVDQQNLAMLNSAFNVACVSNNVDPCSLNDARLNWGGKGTAVTGISSLNDAGEATAQIKADFNTYYVQDNQDAIFRVYSHLIWNKSEGKFIHEAASTFVFEGDGKNKKYNYQQSDIEAYKKSNFADITVEDTLDLVDSLVGMVMSATYEDPDTGEVKGAIASLQADTNFTDFLKANGLNPEDNAQVATGLAFFAAEKMASVDPNAIAAAMTGDATVDINNMYELIGGANKNDFSNKAVSAAIMYAMTAGYAKSEYAPAGTELPTGTDEIASTVQLAGYLSNYYKQDEFKAYLASEDAAADMAGLIGVLRTLETNDENVIDLVKEEDYKFNGDDYYLYDLIDGILNK